MTTNCILPITDRKIHKQRCIIYAHSYLFGGVMYLNYGNYQEDIPSGYINKSVPLWINSCGMYKLINKKELPTFRPKGRLDYQIIYIHTGQGYFVFGGMQKKAVSAGNIVLYHPRETQNYVFYGEGTPTVYWIHFTGADIDSLLKKYGLDADKKILTVGCSAEYVQLFNKIILELQLKRDHYATSASMLMLQLIIMMGRVNMCSSHSALATERLEIEHAADYFHENYHDNICIEKYISQNNLTKNAFFKKFKAHTGISPLQYVLDIRLSSAKDLLKNSDYSISDISTIVGYDNALYFSRLFHKHFGISPREYRNNSLSEEKSSSEIPYNMPNSYNL